MIASLCWLSEFILESSGAVFAFRKRLTLLWLLLGFRAASDICLLVIRMAFGKPAYGIASWISLAGQYLLLCWLACAIIRELVDERDRKLGAYAGLLSAMGGIVAALVFDRSEGLAAKLLDAEIAAGCFLMILVAVAWWTRRAELTGPWPKIAIGWLLSVGWNVLCAFVWTFWEPAPKFMPVGALAALVIWNVSAWRTNDRRTIQTVNEQAGADRSASSRRWPGCAVHGSDPATSLDGGGTGDSSAITEAMNQQRKPVQSVTLERGERMWVN